MTKSLLITGVSIIALGLHVRAQVGSNDTGFNPGSGPNSTVLSISPQTDGKIVIGGTFTSYNGTSKNRITRINADGSLDATFVSGTGAANSVYQVGVLSSGKVMACGQFVTYAGGSAKRLVRINANGSRDATFATSVGANNFVYSFVEQPDAKVIIGGAFTTYDGKARSRIARVNTNGTNDSTFTPGTGVNNTVYSMVLQPDGKILIGGGFSLYNGVSRVRIARINANGTNDASFVTGTGVVGTSTSTTVYCMALQSDGKVIVGGLFNTYNGTASNNLVRLNSNGTIDPTFTMGTGPNGIVRSISVQPDGKIIITGAFTSYNGVSKSRIVRLNSNGTIDNAFGGTGSNNSIISNSMLSNGDLIIGGDFTIVSGDSRTRIAKVHNACPTLTTSLVGQTNNTCFGGSTGSATVSATGGSTFTFSWSPSGGTNAVVTGLSAGTYTCRISNECSNTATSIVTITAPPAVSVTAGASATVCSGSNATLSVSSTGGTGSFSYNWVPGNLSGNNPTVNPSANTIYTVTATDANGCTTTSIQNVDVFALPSISISGGNSVICSGATTSLSASGANTYMWDTGTNTATVDVTPSSTTAFTVSGTDLNGCSNTASKTVTVSGTCAVSTIPCGITITNMNLTASAANVTGATQYRFKFYNSITNALVATKVQASRTITFNTVSGIYYGNTYKWTVAVDKGTGFGAESSNACTITFPPPVTTVLCGKSYTKLNSYSTAQLISGALNYRFTFYDNTTNAVVATKTQPSNYIYFDQVPGLTYGNIYKWTVEVQYSNGTSTLFGPVSNNACTIEFNAPESSVPCGKVYTKLNSYTTADAITAALNYRFTFYDNTTGAVTAVKTQTSNYIYFDQVPGLSYDKIYNWTVEVQYSNGNSNLFGPPSNSLCTIEFGSPVTSVPCGNTYTKTGYTGIPTVYGATGYRFNFYDIATNALIATTTNATPYVYFNQVPGLILDKSYYWTVEVRYNNASGTVFGPASVGSCIMNYGTPSSLVIDGDNVITEETSAARIAQQLQTTNPGEQLWINLYPNPAREDVKIEASENIKQVKIYNIAGELVLVPEHIETIDLKDLKAGIYTVSIETETALKHIKLIKE